MHIYIYIYIYSGCEATSDLDLTSRASVHRLSGKAEPPLSPRNAKIGGDAANLHTKMLDFRAFDSSIILS